MTKTIYKKNVSIWRAMEWVQFCELKTYFLGVTEAMQKSQVYSIDVTSILHAHLDDENSSPEMFTEIKIHKMGASLV